MQLVFNADRKLHTYITLTIPLALDEIIAYRTKNEFSFENSNKNESRWKRSRQAMK